MSAENVELVCRSIKAYNHRDIKGMLECFASDVVVDWSNSHGMNAKVLRGHSELRAMVEDFWEAFDAHWIDHERPAEIREGVVLAENITFLRGRGGGVRVEARGVFLITIQDGKQTSLTLFQTRQEALDSEGLSE
jgi:ketosteroid isomerase-like protein